MNENMMPGLRRWGPWLVAGTVATALVFWAFAPRPHSVEVAVIAKGRFEQLIQEDGQLRLKARYVIAAPMQAELLRPTLQAGDKVEPGDVVAVLLPATSPMIDPRNHLVLQQRVGRDVAARQAARAQLDRLATAFEQAQLEAQRAEQLALDHFLSAAARDQALLVQRAAAQALEAGRAQLRVAEFTLAESQAALSRSKPVTASARLWRIQSPVKGQVVKLHQSSGGPVSTGQPLLDIGDLSAIEAVIDVLSSDARLISPGALVKLSWGADAWDISGRVTRIEPAAFTKISALGIEEQRVNVLVDLEPTSGLKVGDGFRVDARIRLYAVENVLLVPSAALVRDGDNWHVMVMHQDRARTRRVVVKDRHADTAWIDEKSANLREGERVILYPGSLLEGQAVKIRATPSR